ncbi:MAG TPA: hypothetical protein VK144_03280 [Bacillota bacterium]|nr:hypothetical protein [Bacillota bacterium]
MQKDFFDFITVASDEYIQSILSQKLSSYKELVFGESLNERFVLINGVHGVYDKKKEEVRMVDDKDRMSIDGKFVYLRGGKEKLKSGKQRIQRTKDYFVNNRKMHSSFELEKREISKQLDFKAFGFQGDVTLQYFAGDYMIYTYSYTGFITGTAGRTNVIVDLQEDTVNPTYYLGEFGLRTTLEANHKINYLGTTFAC